MRPKKLLVQNADWILSMDQNRKRYRRSDMLISGNTIAAVGGSLSEGFSYDEVVDASGKIIIPGMVNVHHHCAHTLVRNMPQLYELDLYAWLKEIYDPLAFFDEESVYAATLGALGDLLKTGCTTSVDHHYAFPPGHPHIIDQQIRAAAALGIRFHAMRGSLSIGREGGCFHVPPSLVEPADQVAEDCVRLIRTYHDPTKGSMVQIGLAPCWLVYETKEMLDVMRQISQRYRVALHSHLADSREEFSFAKEVHGCTPVEYADAMGYLKASSFFAHCIQLTKSDFARMARSKAGVAYCPNSDMVLRSGLARLPEFYRRHIRTGIGVDGAASNNLSNMIAEVKNAYIIQKSHEIQKKGELSTRLDPDATRSRSGITPEDVLYSATAGGAEVLGRRDIGVLEPGRMADFVVLDWNKFQYAGGRNDPVAAIVLSGDARMVDQVFVNGELVVDKGVLQKIDETSAAAYINRCTDALFQRQQKNR